MLYAPPLQLASLHAKIESVVVDYSLHRPVGQVQLTLNAGRNMVSPEHGLPGGVCCHVIWDPVRLLDEKERKRWQKVDEAALSTEIARTSVVYSTAPNWDVLELSALVSRLQQVLSNNKELSAAPAAKNCVAFPVLQPFKDESSGLQLRPWEQSRGAIVIQVRFSEVVQLLPGSDYLIDEICIPLTELLKKGQIIGWFKVVNRDSTNKLVRATDDDGTHQLHFELRWMAPMDGSVQGRTIEESVFIQEELVRAARLNRQQKPSFLGSSLSAIDTMRGVGSNVTVVHNTIGVLLDAIESAVNAFNFTVCVRLREMSY